MRSASGQFQWAKNRWIQLLFLGFVCVFFFDTLFQGKVILARDTFAEYIPNLIYAGRSYREFTVPLWTTQSAGGHPFLADSATGAAYPINVFFYVFSPAWAHRVTLVFHLALGGLGMLALLRHWGLRRSAALLGAVSFVFSTHVIALAEYFSSLFTICWGPLLLYLASLIYERCLDRSGEAGSFRPWARGLLRDWGLVCVTALSLALSYLSGNAQYLLYSLLLVGGYYLVRLLFDRAIKPAIAAGLTFSIAGLLSLLIAAPQILPFLELLEHTDRATGMDPSFDQGSMHGSQLLTLVLPYLFGVPGGSDAYWAKTLFEFEMGTFYVGILPLVAALLLITGLRGASDETRWIRYLAGFFFVVLVLGFTVSAGKYLPVYELMSHVLPGLGKLRWPAKFLLLAVYGFSILGALGYHQLLQRKARGERFRVERAMLAILALLLLLVWPLLLWVLGFEWWFHALSGAGVEATSERLAVFQRDVIVAIVFMAVFILGLAALLAVKGKSRIQRLEVAMVVLAFINLAMISGRIHPVSDVDVYGYRPEIWETLAARNPGDRNWRVYSNYTGRTDQLYGAADPEIYRLAKRASVMATWLQSEHARASQNSLSLARYYGFLDWLPNLPPELSSRLIDVLNVRYFVTGPPWSDLVKQLPDAQVVVSERQSGLPRAFLVNDWASVGSFQDGLKTLLQPGFDVQSRIVVEPTEGGAMPSRNAVVDGGRIARDAVRSVRYEARRVSIDVAAPVAALLVLNDSWFPGWHATVNGEPRPIYRANLLFRAVEVPAGMSTVVFDYRPVPWRNGLLLAGFGFIVMAGGGVVRWRFGLRSDRPGSPAPSTGSKEGD